MGLNLDLWMHIGFLDGKAFIISLSSKYPVSPMAESVPVNPTPLMLPLNALSVGILESALWLAPEQP